MRAPLFSGNTPDSQMGGGAGLLRSPAQGPLAGRGEPREPLQGRAPGVSGAPARVLRGARGSGQAPTHGDPMPDGTVSDHRGDRKIALGIKM